jgi:large subunit ribosomal protein L1
MAKLTKNRKLALEKIEQGKQYTNSRGSSSLVKDVSTSTKFDASVDIDVRLGCGSQKS